MGLSKEMIKKVEEITVTDYDFNENGETEKWDILIEDLIFEYEKLQEEFDDYKQKQIDRFEDKYWGDD